MPLRHPVGARSAVGYVVAEIPHTGHRLPGARRRRSRVAARARQHVGARHRAPRLLGRVAQDVVQRHRARSWRQLHAVRPAGAGPLPAQLDCRMRRSRRCSSQTSRRCCRGGAPCSSAAARSSRSGFTAWSPRLVRCCSRSIPRTSASRFSRCPGSSWRAAATRWSSSFKRAIPPSTAISPGPISRFLRRRSCRPPRRAVSGGRRARSRRCRPRVPGTAPATVRDGLGQRLQFSESVNLGPITAVAAGGPGTSASVSVVEPTAVAVAVDDVVVGPMLDPALWQTTVTLPDTAGKPARVAVREFERYYTDRTIPEQRGGPQQRRVVEERLVYTAFFTL